MKKFNIFLTAILLFACLLPSCLYNSEFFNSKNEIQLEESSKEGEIWLLSIINYSDNSNRQYEYDDQNRITRSRYFTNPELLLPLSDMTLVYNGNDLDRIENRYGNEEYEKKGNRIIVKNNDGIVEKVYHLNSGGDLIRKDGYNDGDNISETIEYTYDQNGNIIKKTSSSGDITEYGYDNKNSPYIHCKTPKWWMQANGNDTKNNIIKIIRNGKIKEEYVYEYDDEEYPIKCTEYRNGEQVKITDCYGDEQVLSVEYGYEKGNKVSNNSNKWVNQKQWR